MSVHDEITRAEMDILEAKRKLADLRRQVPPEEVEDHVLKDRDGNPVRLSDAFGAKEDLIVVHNMGTFCPYCTMWADGLDGVLDHLENNAAFVVVSPDPPATQRAFAEGRGWRFRMLSAEGSRFTHDMGYARDDGAVLPGFSTFRKREDGTVVRIAHRPFGPGDDFCSVWHVFDLLAGGAGEWQPKLAY